MMKITFKLFATLTDYLPLPARRANRVELDDDGWLREGSSAQVLVHPGSRRIAWQTPPYRSLGQVRIPRLLVRFAFAGIDERQRHTFMKRFDFTCSAVADKFLAFRLRIPALRRQRERRLCEHRGLQHMCRPG